uniref:ARAD1C16456p n=1 Tax=Blastobotrys adeninivorans TaxID=409370 RepID=A0A060T6U6_BLAAD
MSKYSIGEFELSKWSLNLRAIKRLRFMFLEPGQTEYFTDLMSIVNSKEECLRIAKSMIFFLLVLNQDQYQRNEGLSFFLTANIRALQEMGYNDLSEVEANKGSCLSLFCRLGIDRTLWSSPVILRAELQEYLRLASQDSSAPNPLVHKMKNMTDEELVKAQNIFREQSILGFLLNDRIDPDKIVNAAYSITSRLSRRPDLVVDAQLVREYLSLHWRQLQPLHALFFGHAQITQPILLGALLYLEMTNPRSAMYTVESLQLKLMYPGLYEFFYLIMDCTHITLSKKARKKMRTRGFHDYWGPRERQTNEDGLEDIKSLSDQEFRRTIYVPTPLDTDPRDRLYKLILSNTKIVRRFDNISEALSRRAAEMRAADTNDS